jgi:hypothetical protein
LEAFVWREVVIENKEDPCGRLPVLEQSKAIGGKAKCNIVAIREVSVGQHSVVDNNTLSKELEIMEPIKNICCLPGFTCPWVFLSMVLETSGIEAIRHECMETRDKGHIGKHLPCSTRCQSQCLAIWAFIKVSIQTSIANARIDATCKLHGLEAGECPNMGSHLVKILYVYPRKDI